MKHVRAKSNKVLFLNFINRSQLTKTRLIVIITAGLLAAFAFYIAVLEASKKTVTLEVEGQVTEVTTREDSVEAILAEAGVEIPESGQIVPSLTEEVADGGTISVRELKELTLEIDGKETTVSTAAADSSELLELYEGRNGGVSIIASRNSNRAELEVPIKGVSSIVVKVDGGERAVNPGLENLPEILAKAEVTLAELDKVRVEKAAGKAVIIVERVEVKEVTSEEKIPFETVTELDAKAYAGEKAKQKVAGVDGTNLITYKVTLVDGKEVSKVELRQEVAKAPVAAVKVVGTIPGKKPVEKKKAVAASASNSAKSTTAAPAKKWTGNGDVWSQLAKCESGGNPRIVSKSGRYHGLYQFSVSTWRSVGGKGLPSQASPEEQTKRAQMLQQRSGWGQWPACSKKIGVR